MAVRNKSPVIVGSSLNKDKLNVLAMKGIEVRIYTANQCYFLILLSSNAVLNCGTYN